MENQKKRYTNKTCCCVPSCGSKGYMSQEGLGRKLSFHRFPRDEARCRVWIERVNPSLSLEKVNNPHVCSLHFLEAKYMSPTSNRLVHDAVPEINLPFFSVSEMPSPSFSGVVPSLACNLSSVSGTSTSLVSGGASHAEILLPSVSSASAVLANDISSVSGTSTSSVSGVQSPAAINFPSLFSEPDSSLGINFLCDSPLPTPSTSGQSSANISLPSVSGISVSPNGMQDVYVSGTTSEPSTSNDPRPLVSTSFSGVENKSGRKRLLQQFDLCRDEVTPRKQKMLKSLRETTKKFNRLRNDVRKSRGQLKKLAKVAESDAMSYFLQKEISPAAALLVSGDARNRSAKPKQRRWTRKEKVLALAIYKRSPKAYNFLSSLIVLPSKSSLHNLLRTLPFNVGMNQHIINHLGQLVRKKNMDQPGHEFCALYLDELSLRFGLFYREHEDRVEGFEDYGELGRASRTANHAMVFMARGLLSQWKQPVAYYFCQSTTPTDILEELIISVINSLFSVGIIVKAVVSDQASTNRSALRNLVSRYPTQSNANFMFQVNGEEIVTICDVPHLLKCTRNNFMKYDVISDGVLAKWQHVKLLLEANENCLYSLVNKIQVPHINPKGKDKMRVKYAAQVFSRTCHCVIKVLIDGFPQVMPSEARGTADFLLFINNLFDSLNGSRLVPPPQSPLQCRLSQDSPHEAFWENALIQLSNLQFINSVTGKVFRPPFQDGWITSINAVQHLWRILQTKGFVNLNLRCLNQDGLENFFSAIRQFGGDNSNPTCTLFCAAFKTCVLNNLSSSHSRLKNCEDDAGSLLSTLNSFIGEEDTLNDCSNVSGDVTEDSLNNYSNISDGVTEDLLNDRFNFPDEITEDLFNEHFIVSGDVTKDELHDCSVSGEVTNEDIPVVLDELNFAETEAAVYVSGYIAKCLINNNSDCNICRLLLTVEPESSESAIMSTRDVEGRLVYASPSLCHDVQEAVKIAKELLPKIIHSDGVGRQLSDAVKQRCSFSWTECSDHQDALLTKFLSLFSRVTIHQYCRQKNREKTSKHSAEATKRKNRIFQHI